MYTAASFASRSSNIDNRPDSRGRLWRSAAPVGVALDNVTTGLFKQVEYSDQPVDLV